MFEHTLYIHLKVWLIAATQLVRNRENLNVKKILAPVYLNELKTIHAVLCWTKPGPRSLMTNVFGSVK